MGALAWLGVRMLAQDRDVERQRRRETIEIAAGRLALEIDRRIREIEERLAGGAGVRLLDTGLESDDGRIAILYQPESPAEIIHTGPLREAEAAEFQRRDLAGVAAAYQHIAASPDPALRAAALVGLGRVLRKLGDRERALRAYRDLEQLGRASVGGQPARLVALQGRCKTFEEAGDRDAHKRAAQELAQALSAGGWRIDRATFDLYREMVTRWGASPPNAAVVAATDAAIEVWRTWRRNELPTRGRRVIRTETIPILAVWIDGPEHPVTSLIATTELGVWLNGSVSGLPLMTSISDLDGHPVLGQTAPSAVSLTPGETGLPFVLHAYAGEPARGVSRRRVVVISGLVVTCVLMLLAAYGIYGATMREMVLARQQSDFVSAVSHEFRTPLTSMRHLTEILTNRGVATEERRTHYYQLLASETDRLHRMVESLLSFGRLEAGGYAWQLEPVNLADFVRKTVEEFRAEAAVKDRVVTFEARDGLPLIQVDPGALSRAVWNLLDNAIKYSEAPSPVHVLVRGESGAVLLSVADKGIGVPAAERDRIFHKFVRGADANRAGIRGVGIGLSIVKRIAEAHGGTVRLDSTIGIGTTFTIALPAKRV
jgi:signal transduction histidine kinase